MAQGAACASPVVVTPLSASFRLDGPAGTKSSPIPNGEPAKHSPIALPSTVSLLSASSHMTPLRTSAGACCCCAPPLPSPPVPAHEDLETPPLAHVAAKGAEREGDVENDSLPALLARVSRPPPFPLEEAGGGGREGEDGNGGGEEEQEEEQEQERERELPEPARSANANDDDEDEAGISSSSSSSVQEALSSLALVDEA